MELKYSTSTCSSLFVYLNKQTQSWDWLDNLNEVILKVQQK